jgi:uncharacterized protein YndB with AHSA1/START domain
MPVGQTKDAGWEIGVSRTLPVSVDEVWRVLTGDDGVAVWLGEGVVLQPTKGAPYETDDGTVGEVRSFRPLDRVRLTWQPADWDHDSTVQVAVRGDGSKTMLRFHQERLADADERERQRAHWQAVMDQMATLLGVE